ncbi:TonB-dependent receptor, partial [Bacteroidota bacterium]
IAYSYARSTMLVKSVFPGENINNGLSYPSNYDRPHNLNIVSNFKVDRRLSFSTNLVYTTGRPVTYPISIYYMEGIQHVHYSERNKYRIPDYFRIDLSVNLEGNLKRKKLAHSFWMLNVYNLSGRKNAYSVYFKNDSGTMNGYKLSVFGQPVITLSWNFKFGNYASE